MDSNYFTYQTLLLLSTLVDLIRLEEIIATTKYGKLRGIRREISVRLPGGMYTLTSISLIWHI